MVAAEVHLLELGWSAFIDTLTWGKRHRLQFIDVALKIVTTYPDLGTGSILEVLARKPEAFCEMKLNVISRTIRWCKILYSKMLSTPQRSQIENPEVGKESGLEDSSLGPEPFPENVLA
ncbi:hypothetical protein HanRHA438_Chr07g0319881 [Helianthus annuus]|nr:hypothetical protein HanRHA438_Chr07g0319881 [Helianthus annuus]